MSNSSAPDSNHPIPFGYKCAWFAIKTEQPEALISLFPRYTFKPASWQQGHNESRFITPVVEGWTFIIGGDLPTTDTQEGIKEIEALLIRASTLGKACFFGSHRGVDYYSWACAENGKLLRGYSEADGEFLWDAGEKQGLEKTFVFPQEAENDPKSLHQDFPDEDMVIAIAADWSLDPTTLDRFTTTGNGYLS